MVWIFSQTAGTIRHNFWSEVFSASSNSKKLNFLSINLYLIPNSINCTRWNLPALARKETWGSAWFSIGLYGGAQNPQVWKTTLLTFKKELCRFDAKTTEEKIALL
ncbi:MAG: hypothetical protein WC371_03855 [Parachlamydiales bacterium]|jgi:hypothetical protein